MSSPQQPNEFQEQVNQLNQLIIELSAQDIKVDDYLKRFLDTLVQNLGDGGAIFHLFVEDEISMACHTNLAAAQMDQNGAQQQLLSKVIQHVIEKNEPVVLPPAGESNLHDGGLAENAVNKSHHTIFFLPIALNERICAVLVMIMPQGMDPRSHATFLQVLTALCEHPSNFILKRQFGDYQARISDQDRLLKYYASLHENLDPRRSCYALANYAQSKLDVFRCMAATYSQSGKFKIESVSGLESVAVKSSFIKTISGVAKRVCENNKILLVDNPNAVLQAGNDNDDTLLASARLFMLESKSLVLGVFPISHNNIVVGCLIVEKAIDEVFDDYQLNNISAITKEASVALHNGLAHRDMPLSMATRGIATVRNKAYSMSGGRRTFWLCFWLFIILLPFMIRKDVKVTGSAELVPVLGQMAYAQVDGQIATIKPFTSNESRVVEAGEIIATLDTRVIDASLEEVENQISEAAMSHHAALNSNALDVRKFESITKGLVARRDAYLVAKEYQTIKAPVGGKVINRDSYLRQLKSKPVSRGDAIVEIVPHDSQWELIVLVEEDKAGELLQAYDNLGEGETLTAKVILNAYLTEKFETNVISVASRAFVESTGQQKYRNVLEVRLAQPQRFKDLVSDPRQGLEGTVAIVCARKSLFYAVTHEFFNFIRVTLF